MSRVLITGSSGFLGLHLLRYSPQTHEIIAHYCTHKPEKFHHRITPFCLDFYQANLSALDELNPQVIIHAAAMANIDACEEHPREAHYLNFEITRQLVERANKTRARFIFISSDVVFDGEKGDYTENDNPRPLNVYARTKTESEKYILNKLPDSVIIRPALFYGLALNGRPSFTEIMLKKLKANQEVKVFTDQFRTPILVNDLTNAIWELATNDFRGIIHLAGIQKLNRFELGQILCELLQLDTDLLIPVKSSDIKLKVVRPLDCSLNTSLAQSILKTKFVDCRTGLKRAYGEV
jgi:dTDP-4-dehydrorhamnose reductase